MHPRERRVIYSDGSVGTEVWLSQGPDRVSWTTADIPFPISTLCDAVTHDFTFEPSAGGTEVRWTAQFRAKGGLSRFALSWLVEHMYETYMDEVLERLEQVAIGDESGEPRELEAVA